MHTIVDSGSVGLIGLFFVTEGDENLNRQEPAKIILVRVKIEDLNIRIFYKFLLNIKPRYICCHLNKQINRKPPVRFSRA